MANLTLTKARTFLGKLAEGVSDADLEQEIKTVQFFKMLYFSHVRKTSVNCSYNKDFRSDQKLEFFLPGQFLLVRRKIEV
jgi:hypothetical protein